MAIVALAPQNIQQTGLAEVFTGSLSVSDTYTVRNNGRVYIHFKKTGAGACTVTFVTPGTVGGLAVADQTASIPATTGDKVCGPFPPEVFNDGNGDLSFTLSDIAGLSVAVLQG